MKKVDKIGQSGPFFKLDKRRRKAVRLLFEDELSDEEIAKAVQRRRSTLDNWKHDELFRAAQQQYNHLVVKKDFESKALRRLVKLLDAKSEMVQLQAANSILKLSGMLSDNSTPELNQAKVRKAIADARVAEARAKTMEDHGQDIATALDKVMDKLIEESDKEAEKQDGDENGDDPQSAD